MADRIVPHFHNNAGVAAIAHRRARVHVRRRAAALRPSAHLHRHGRRGRGDLLLLLDLYRFDPSLDPRQSDAAGLPLPAGRAKPRDMRIAVAGGGIAGLTAAIALAQRGFAVDLFERAQALEEIGAGIQLSPNAMAVLRAARRCRRPGAARRRAARRSRSATAQSGAILNAIPLGKTARSRYGAPYARPPRRPAGRPARAVRRQRRDRAPPSRRGARRSRDGGRRRLRAGGQRLSRRCAGRGGRHSTLACARGHFRLPRRRGRSARPPGAPTLPTAMPAARLGAMSRASGSAPGAHLVHYPLQAANSSTSS